MMDLYALVKECAPQVAPQTMLAIIKTESNGKPFIIYDNTDKKSVVFSDKDKAIKSSYSLIAKGHNIDFGLTQINIKNAEIFHLKLNDVFDPCTNIKYGSFILTKAYLHFAKDHTDEHLKLLRAFSLYNTGSSHKGFTNGYVEKVVKNSHVITISQKDN